MTESIETIKSERDFLWTKSLKLYNSITQNGKLSAAHFRQALGIAGNMFKEKGVDMSYSQTWVASLADFLDMVETAKAQNIGPK